MDHSEGFAKKKSATVTHNNHVPISLCQRMEGETLLVFMGNPFFLPFSSNVYRAAFRRGNVWSPTLSVSRDMRKKV